MLLCGKEKPFTLYWHILNKLNIVAKKEKNTEVSFCYMLISISDCLVALLDVTIKTVDSAFIVLN